MRQITIHLGLSGATKMEEKILFSIHRNPGITTFRIAEMIGHHPVSVSTALGALLESKYIQREIRGRYSHWTISNPEVRKTLTKIQTTQETKK